MSMHALLQEKGMSHEAAGEGGGGGGVDRCRAYMHSILDADAQQQWRRGSDFAPTSGRQS